MKTTKRIVALVLTLAMCLSLFAMGASAATTATESSAFADEFADPTSNEWKPGIRYWFSPGRMTEEQTRWEIRNFADMGYGHVELISLEQTTVQMNSKEWNDVMYWILDEAAKVGIQIDVTLGEFWPIATEAIPKDEAYSHPDAEQKLSVGAVDFVAAEGNMTYSATEWANPSYTTTGWRPQTVYTFDPNYPFALVALTAAKKNDDGTFDPDSAVVLTDLVNQETGAVEWTAPSEGNWSIFWAYQVNTGKILSFGVDATVVDHLNMQGTMAVINDFEQGFDTYEAETGIDLRALYRAAGGDFFGDSFELSSSTMWTWDFLEEFEARRGYDLTPYIATVWNSGSYNDASATRTYEFADIGAKVRNDYGLTVSELIADEHLAIFRDWAHEELGMELRYQVHSSAGSLLIDETVGALATDTPETESYALGNSLDSYRSKSAAATMMNSKYGAETAAEGGMAWVQTWTGSKGYTGTRTDKDDHGLMYFTNRLFAGGVNHVTLHGATYQLEGELPGLFGGSFSVNFPGYSLMEGMGYPNDWANSTPLYTFSEEMLNYLARTQMVLQQGQADLDLAVYRLFTTPATKVAAPSELNLSGYTYEYVTNAILSMENAVVGEMDGQKVLAPVGPSYQALIIDQRATRNGQEPFAMTVETANIILGYAKAGLPVVIVGEAPSVSASMVGSDAELVAVMDELKTVATCVESSADLEAALLALNVKPDADVAEAGTSMFYHRNDENVDYYFMANDSTEEVDTMTLTLKGEGQPYVLNAWTGEIAPVAEYTVGEGTVTIEVELAPTEQALYAVAENGFFGTTETGVHAVDTTVDNLFYVGNYLFAETATAGAHTVTLDNGEVVTINAEAPEALTIDSWDMVIHQWLPLNLNDPTYKPWKHQVVDTEVFTLANTDEEMVGWALIDESLAKVMGVAEYTATFTVEDASDLGAIVNFQDVSDTMGLTINGVEIPVNQIDNDTDISPWLVDGVNTLVVEVTSAAGNYKGNATQNYGILGAVTLETTKLNLVDVDEVILNLAGPADVTVEDAELSYILSVAETNKLATAELVFAVDGNVADASATGLNGWEVLTYTFEDGVLTALAYTLNANGLTTEESVDVVSVNVTTTEEVGEVSVALLDATLSAFNGPDSEAWVTAVAENDAVTTTVNYSIYDVNQDGTVNQLDITRAQRFYGKSDELADVNDSGLVDITDFVLIMQNYSK